MPKQALERTDKPWGHEVLWARTDAYAAKLLHIRAGHMLSLQLHVRKTETVLVQSGRLRLLVEMDGADGGAMEELLLLPGEAHHIPAGRRHRMAAAAAAGGEDCVVVEVSTPELEDVVRLEDAYGRV